MVLGPPGNSSSFADDTHWDWAAGGVMKLPRIPDSNLSQFAESLLAGVVGCFATHSEVLADWQSAAKQRRVAGCGSVADTNSPADEEGALVGGGVLR
jgi:hypothetical protein